MEKATLHRAPKLDNLLLFKAHYHKFQFTRHCHDDFALGLMYRGVQRFSYRGAARYAPAGTLITVNPGEIHDGMSGDDSDFSYRIMYIPWELMQTIGEEMVAGRKNHYFAHPVINDRELSQQLGHLLQLLDDDTSEQLELEVLFSKTVASLLSSYGTEQLEHGAAVQIPSPVAQACAYIRDHAHEHISLDDIAAAAHLSRYHFLRLFSDAMDISPYSFLLHHRLQLAKKEIRLGVSLAESALNAGFADQSHMNRRFKSAFGITPRQYQKAIC
ncbi:AraC family transcriptional regulator [Desulfopila sp. IMCC35008]|uniref:helix-turn-helix transcriptional regulator n=1 Tax=Desulfopila sp. IMCC35008 TaxID=2653858 RepID=UPI0013D62802|nr:AraC family transcriptional regulator [Desulfopila sp. IMCC35008]